MTSLTTFYKQNMTSELKDKFHDMQDLLLAHKHLPKCHFVCQVLWISHWIEKGWTWSNSIKPKYTRICVVLVCVVFEGTLLLYPHNWWSLHCSFVWRLRRHKEGLDRPCTNKVQSRDEVVLGGVTLLHGATWGMGGSATQGVWGLFLSRQDGGVVVTNWAGQYVGEGADRG